MPRFYFHIRDADQRRSRDELGLDFPDAETAYLEAFRSAEDIRAEFMARAQNPQDYAIEVTNAADELVFDLPFSEIFDRHAGRHAPRSEIVRAAREQGDRMMRLTAEVAEQVRLVRENLRRSRDLLNSLGQPRGAG
ncbi:hypothetical protein KBI52_04585 [Microvirga sp. HBU67558]|uniref:DUF6894 family protein n=1 Tax=Microvirga TaxID=186650 RepID=UPI001B36B23C|nr:MULTISPECIES: hypothetical protein [unclassified Microvirga]MBQ0819500.1 hypothetical protein [Microvirga sp. HBU67558]